MASVTQRVKEVKQPQGGYLPMKSFAKEHFDDGIVLNENENIHSSLVGIAVDYLTRLMLGDSADKAFHISYLGAWNIGMRDKATFFISNVKGLDNASIIYACKLAGFDVCYRSSKSAYKPVENINPDAQTIENIRTMVNRSLSFWNKYGPVICSEPTFEGGYTDTVNTGDGDFLTQDTLWDFKVTKSAPTTKHSLQILMYYVMGTHSIHEHYRNVSNLGFFNPRLNIAYVCPITSISKETITDIEKNVICYGISGTFHHEDAKTQQSSPEVHTVADISSMTGFKKSEIYADIREGNLKAFKKGNKYLVSHSDFVDYVEYIEHKQRVALITGLGIAIAVAVAMIFVIISAICL